MVPINDLAPSSSSVVGQSASDFFHRRFARGERVEVLWNGRWWPAVVLESRTSNWLVHYEGYAEEWDEMVDSERIRERSVSANSEEPSEDDP